MNLPEPLQSNLADSELVVTSWSNDTGELTAQLDRDGGATTARLAFRGVLHVNLPPSMVLDSVEAHTPDSVPPDCWQPGAPRRSERGDSETIFLLFDRFGGRFFVVAEDLSVEALQ